MTAVREEKVLAFAGIVSAARYSPAFRVKQREKGDTRIDTGKYA